MKLLPKAVDEAREVISKVVKKGDVAVDATAGNGLDTLFLAKLVGESGRVYAFDIQKEALENTRQRLQKEDLLSRVELIRAGHENMEEYVPGHVSAVMFNLGYLPGGNHRVITRPQTTIQAIESSLKMLQAGGIITIVVYTGHEGGEEEKKDVLDYCSSLDQRCFTAVLRDIINQVNKPPLLVAVEKLKGKLFEEEKATDT